MSFNIKNISEISAPFNTDGYSGINNLKEHVDKYKKNERIASENVEEFIKTQNFSPIDIREIKKVLYKRQIKLQEQQQPTGYSHAAGVPLLENDLIKAASRNDLKSIEYILDVLNSEKKSYLKSFSLALWEAIKNGQKNVTKKLLSETKLVKNMPPKEYHWNLQECVKQGKVNLFKRLWSLAPDLVRNNEMRVCWLKEDMINHNQQKNFEALLS